VYGSKGGVPPQTSAFGAGSSVQWGLPGDRAAPGDYDGDGRQDWVVFRPSESRFYLRYSNGAPPQTVTLGEADDVVVPADYDGDGRTDLALWRPTGARPGRWLIRSSTSQSVTEYLSPSGGLGVQPAVADYDADGRADRALFAADRAAAKAEWTGVYSGGGGVGGTFSFVRPWSGTRAFVTPGNFLGRDRADFAFWDDGNGVWTIYRPELPYVPVFIQWGKPGDLPVALDVNADGYLDPTVFRPATGEWFTRPLFGSAPLRMKPHGPGFMIGWGRQGDVPLR